MSGRIVSCLRYEDAPKAIDWLGVVFGFEPRLVVPGNGGTVSHAELVLGGSMIMVSSIVDTPASALMLQPGEVGGRETQSPYLVVKNADEVHARVLAKAGRVVIPLQDFDYGGRGFSCTDPEGHVWHVGTYDPWAE